MWVLGYSHNGFFQKFQVYTGKGGSGEKNLGQRVVKELTEHLHKKNHHVFVYNCFTSEQLLQDLLVKDIYSCGTARKDRKGFPELLKAIELPNRYFTML